MIYARGVDELGGHQGRILCDRFGRPLTLSANEFGELLTSQQAKIFDSKQVTKASPAALFDHATTGDGAAAYQSGRSSQSLTVASSGSAIRQTRRAFNYLSGNRQAFDITYIAHSVTGDGEVCVGPHDGDNGIFLRQRAGEDLAFVIRSDVSGSPVDTVIERADWEDPLDGTGPSHFRLEPDTAQIVWFGYTWLGVGSVRAGFRWGGQFIECLREDHVQELSSVYMRTPNLPVRWAATATAGSVDLEAICCTVASEGGQDPGGIPRGDWFVSKNVAAGTITELITGRLVAGSTTTIIPAGFEVSSTSGATGKLILCYRPTWNVGVASAYRDVRGENTTSHIQLTESSRLIATTPANLPNLGHILGVTELEAKATKEVKVSRQFALGRSIAGVADELSLVCWNDSLIATTCRGNVSWVELV